MCAKKATSATAKKSTAKVSGKPTAKASENGQATTPSPAPAAAAKSIAKASITKSLSAKTVPAKAAAKVATERTLSSHHIGEVAGEIWQLLSDGEAQTLAVVKKSVKAPADIVTAAIGWLARENKLEFTTSGKTLKLTLK